MLKSWRVKDWFPALPENTQNNLHTFAMELEKFNPTLNLLSTSAIEKLDSDHFYDSIVGLRLVVDGLVNKTIYDFGSGNGFPGVVGGIVFPEINWKLVESDVRKCEFLKYCCSTMKVNNVTILNQRVEKLNEGEVTIATARGFAPLDQALLVSSKVFASGGVFYHFKGPSWSKELAKVPSQVFSKWSISEKGQYDLPDDKSLRFIIESKKN